MGPYFVSYSVPLIYMSAPLSLTPSHDYYSCIRSLTIGLNDSSHFILFQNYFSCSNSFVSPYKFWTKLAFIYRYLAEILIRIILNLYINLGRIDIFAMLGITIHERSVSLCLFAFYFFHQQLSDLNM